MLLRFRIVSSLLKINCIAFIIRLQKHTTKFVYIMVYGINLLFYFKQMKLINISQIDYKMISIQYRV